MRYRLLTRSSGMEAVLPGLLTRVRLFRERLGKNASARAADRSVATTTPCERREAMWFFAGRDRAARRRAGWSFIANPTWFS